MDELYNIALLKKLEKLTLILSIMIGIVGFSVLVGWYFDIQLLKSIHPNLIAMKPNAALSFVLISISLLLQRKSKKTNNASHFLIAKTLAAVVMLIGFATFMEGMTGINLHIDQLLFSEKPGSTVFYEPGRMSPLISFNFILIGLSLFFLDVKSFTVFTQLITLAVGIFAVMSIAGVTYHAGVQGEFVRYAYISAHASINFILISITILSLRPTQGFTKIMSTNTEGGYVSRRLISLIIILPVFLGYLIFYGESKNLYDPRSGMAFFAALNIIVLLLFVFWVAEKLMRTDIMRKNAYNKLQRTVMELQYTNNEFQHLIRVTTHDLQEPLRIVSSFTQLLSKRYKDKIDSDANDFINFAVDGAIRMQNQLNDLLSYTHIIYDPDSIELTDCNTLLQEAIADLKTDIESKHAEIIATNLPTININPKQIKIVFKNILSNAIKFCDKKPTIHVSAQENEKEWIFTFGDNGIGIAPEYQKQIFILFNRLNKRDKYSGTGAGLPIARKIIEFHQGKIWVTTNTDGGSNFCFTITK